jgi:flagellar protein FlaG
MKVSAVNSATPPNVERKMTVSVNAGATDKSTNTADANPEHLVKAVEKLNQNAEATNRQVRFALYNNTHRIFVEVVDKQTNEVVATFPPKQILKMAEALDQMSLAINQKINKEV